MPAERTVLGSTGVLGGGSHPHEPSTAHQQRPENALDALLDELQTFSRPSSQMGQAPIASTVQPATTTTLAAAGVAAGTGSSGRAPCISEIGRKGSVDSSSGILASNHIVVGAVNLATSGTTGTLRRLHSYPSSSDTDTSPPIARLQVSIQEPAGLPQALLPQGQKPPVPERNAELLQLASARRVPPPPPPRTSSRSPLASPTSPQLPPRNHPSSSSSSSSSSCTVAQQQVTVGTAGNATAATLRRPLSRPSKDGCSLGKPPMALPSISSDGDVDPASIAAAAAAASIVLSTSNSSSCESVNSQEGLQSKRGRQEQLEQRHQELLRKQKALQEQYARLQQLQRNAAGLATVPPAPPDLLKKTGSESNLLAKMGLGMSAASSGSLTSLSLKTATAGTSVGEGNARARFDGSIETTSVLGLSNATVSAFAGSDASTATVIATAATDSVDRDRAIATETAFASIITPTITTTTTNPLSSNVANSPNITVSSSSTTTTTTTTTSKIYETDIL